MSGNALESVREYCEALDSEARPDGDIKVFVLGNGRAGKTSLILRLKDMSPAQVKRANPSSTHGVMIETVEASKGWKLSYPVRFCMWDFGGQDIYHGTHALFLHGPALFLLLYSHAIENDDLVAEGGFQIRNRRLPYWFDYLRQEASVRGVVTNPVLLIQGRCDEPPGRDGKPPYQPAPGQFPHLSQLIPVDTVKDSGLGHLPSELEEVLTSFLERHPHPP